MTSFKKSLIWSIMAVSILTVLTFLGLTNSTTTDTKESILSQKNAETNNQKGNAVNNVPKGLDEVILREINPLDIQRIELRDGSGLNNQYSIENQKIINDVIDMIKQSKEYQPDPRLRSFLDEQRILLYKKDGSKLELYYKDDDLYNIGYVRIGKVLVQPDYSFFRYVRDLSSFYSSINTHIEQDVIDLFTRYHWTVDYQINNFEDTLPNNFKHSAGEYPIKLYYAYNNELSKEIGLDFSTYLGKNVRIDIYRLRESLPESMKPRKNARGIMIRYENKIIGAYIDAGRHSSFAVSLNRKTLEQITEKDWGTWVEGYIDTTNKIDNYLAGKSPEGIIQEYFKALNAHDEQMLYALYTKRVIVNRLSTNMENTSLFNEGYGDNNVNSASLVEIKEMKNNHLEEGMVEYFVTADYDFKKMITDDDGRHPRFFILKKESEKLGWRIEAIGTGP